MTKPRFDLIGLFAFLLLAFVMGVMLTDTFEQPAAEQAGMAVATLGPTPLSGISEPVELYAITSCPALPDRAVDPTCRMAVVRSEAAASRADDGVEHLFCSLECATAFDRSSASEG